MKLSDLRLLKTLRRRKCFTRQQHTSDKQTMFARAFGPNYACSSRKEKIEEAIGDNFTGGSNGHYIKTRATKIDMHEMHSDPAILSTHSHAPARFVTGGYWQFLSSYNTWFDQWPKSIKNPSSGDMIATLQGYVSIIVHNDIRIDLTIDRAIRLVNNRVNMKLSITPSGRITALLSPTGRVYQYGNRVETVGFGKNKINNKFAKIWNGGISFTSDSSALVFLLDEGGTRSTTDKFCDLISYDFSKSVFFAESLYGPQYVDECLTILNTARYTVKSNGDEKWIINGIKIEQNTDGFVRVSRDHNRIQIKTSLKGTSGVTTPYIHCTASVGIQEEPKHLFVRQGERRMHYDGEIFVVRNGSHSAGFDSTNKLTVF